MERVNKIAIQLDSSIEESIVLDNQLLDKYNFDNIYNEEGIVLLIGLNLLMN